MFPFRAIVDLRAPIHRHHIATATYKEVTAGQTEMCMLCCIRLVLTLESPGVAVHV
jgi:hypothetical protein